MSTGAALVLGVAAGIAVGWHWLHSTGRLALPGTALRVLLTPCLLAGIAR